MKNQILERFSASGHLRTRFEEILEKVESNTLPRMDGGDQIGQLIVANLEALPRRSKHDSALLFEAQKARAALYHESSGATTLEAAESLIAARGTLEELNQDPEALQSLLGPAQDVFDELVKIGSKRNAWLCLEIMITCLRNTTEHQERVPKVLADFAEFSRDMIFDGREPNLLNVLLSHCDWARVAAPDQFPELVALVPLMLEQHTHVLPWQSVLRAYLYARHLSLGFGAKALADIATKMASLGKIDTEVRVVYQDYLCEAGPEKVQLEDTLRKLAEVDPNIDEDYDSDLDSLNTLLSEHFPDREWVWRNRALLSRRQDDRAGALVFLSRAMSIDGEPPVVMGLMAPVLSGLGFLQTAFQFARFSTQEIRDQFGLSVLRLLAAEPESKVGCQRLQLRLERALLVPHLQAEFRTLILSRRAELLYRAGDFEESRSLYAEIFRDNLSDEIAAVRLAELSLIDGDTEKVHTFLRAKFSDRVQPFVKHIESRIAQENNDLALAWQKNEDALSLVPAAQAAGRQSKIKTLAMLENRIRSMFGEDQVHCSLLAMLQVETHAPPHRDLVDLARALQRRAVDLGILRGDVSETSDRIQELIRKDVADTDVFIAGARVSLENNQLDAALDLLWQAEESGHGDGSEIRVLRGKTYMRHGDFDAAFEQFENELAVKPNAEARLLQAMIELERDNSAEALVHLAKVREEDGGSPEVRFEIANLKGILLERQGRHSEARICYLLAVEAKGGPSDARYRAGILGLEAAMDDEGYVVDRNLMDASLVLLDGVKDSDAICRRALAKAAISDDVDDAIHCLERAMMRTNGQDELRLKKSRLALLLNHDRARDALSAAEELLDSGSDEYKAELAILISSLRKRCLLQRMASEGNVDPEIVAQCRASQTKNGKRDDALRLIMTIADPDSDEITVNRGASPAVQLAAAIAGGQRKKDGKMRAGVLNDGAVGIEAVEAKNILVAMESGSAKDLLDAVDSFDAAELTLPWTRKDVLAIIAAKAMSENNQAMLKMVSKRDPGQFREHEKLSTLIEMIRSKGADTTRVMNLLCDLSGRLLESGSDSEDLVMHSIRRGVTELRETPSPAWASARLRCAGMRTRVHEKSAEIYWRSRFENGEDDTGEALHHLALMSVSRAHESEIDGVHCPELWREVHEIWGQLIEHNPFWVSMMDRLGGADFMEVISRIREHVAGWILQAQVALAKRRLFAGELPKAIEHARIAATSRLMNSCDRNFVENLIFRALCGEFEKHIHNNQFDKAMECIDRVIVADPSNPIAMREMVTTAAMSLERSLGVLDSLRRPDESMLTEIGVMMNSILMTSERSIRDLAAMPCDDPALGQSLITGLRSLAFVEGQRERSGNDQASLIDRAITIAESCSIDSSQLRRIRSEIGLDLVEETMSLPITREQKITGFDQEPLKMAMDEVDRLIAIDPGNVKVIAQKAKLLLVAHRDDEAESLARDLFKDAQSKNAPEMVRAAVELMHQVQSEREKLRYESKMEMVDRMCASENWRAALDLFREATVGRENEPDHLLKHVDILIGLRKLDRASTLIDSLEDCEALEDDWQLRKARLSCIRSMFSVGGDLLSAFELFERGNFEKALKIVDELLAAESKDGPLQFIAATCHSRLGSHERAQAHAKAAKRCALAKDKLWIRTLIDEEIGA